MRTRRATWAARSARSRAGSPAGATASAQRLIRRGVAPSALGPIVALVETAPVAGFASLADAIVPAAVHFAAADAARISPSVLALAHGVHRTMTLATLRAALVLPLALVLSAGSLAAVPRLLGSSDEPAPVLPAVGLAQAPAPALPLVTPPQPPPSPADEFPTALAWRQAEPFQPPDFFAFFPDDPEGGKALDALWAANRAEARPPTAEELRVIRRGMRRARGQHSSIIRWTGRSLIWGQSPQSPEAIEILYHAADYQHPEARRFGTQGWAIYFGLSVVEPKPPAVLRAMVEYCLADWNTDMHNNWGRVAWGARSQRAELLAQLRPHLDAAEPAERAKAALLAKVFGEEPDARDAFQAWNLARLHREHDGQLAAFRRELAEGESAARARALDALVREQMTAILDESFVDPLLACGRDADGKTREALCWVLGRLPLVATSSRRAELVDLIARLTEDPDPQVRYYVVYAVLTPRVPEVRHDEFIRRLAMIAADPINDIRSRIVWGLKSEGEPALRVLDEAGRGDDPKLATSARSLYRELTGRGAPGTPADPAARAGYAPALRELHAFLGANYPNFALKGIDWAAVGRDLLPRVERATTEDEFGRLVLELVARLEDSHAVVLPGSVGPPPSTSAAGSPASPA